MSWQEFFKEKRITIMGLAAEGRGVQDAEFAARYGAKVIVTDIKKENELKESVERLSAFPNITFVLGEHRTEDFTNTDLVIRSATAPLGSPFLAAALEARVPIHTDESLFFKLAPKLTTIGITGTRGKSTVTLLIYEILRSTFARVYVGGNLRGVATLPLLEKAKSGDYIVMELDSWKLQGLGAHNWSPHVAIFTTFMNDHMNYYRGDMNIYWQDKSQIFRFQNERDYLIVSDQVAPKIKTEQFLPAPAAKITTVRAVDFPKNWKLKILGEHNALNAALAIAATQLLGVPEEKIKNITENFSGVEGRLQYLGEKKGVHIYNDNNATSPDATIAALKALREKYPNANIILIGGGADKELDFEELSRTIAREVKTIILFEGMASNKLKKLLPHNLLIRSGIGSMHEAVGFAFKEAQREDVILLSPGAASFGIFKNEYDRNDQFISEVAKYR